jgi:hypothetical protein
MACPDLDLACGRGLGAGGQAPGGNEVFVCSKYTGGGTSIHEVVRVEEARRPDP